jgi:uncharacterized protein (TIGR02391 family)
MNTDKIERLERLIAEADGGQPADRGLWRERARAELVEHYGDAEHREVKRFEAALFPGIVRSPGTIRSGQFAEAEQKATIRANNMLKAFVELLHRQGAGSVAQTPDLGNIHPLIRETSGALYVDGHYSSAIFEAFKTIEARVRDLTGIDESGRPLMSTAFGGDNPPLRLNELSSRSDRDEQEGFKLIFMGAQQGIRNPKAHDVVLQEDAERALDYLSLASLLMRRLDDAERLL